MPIETRSTTKRAAIKAPKRPARSQLSSNEGPPTSRRRISGGRSSGPHEILVPIVNVDDCFVTPAPAHPRPLTTPPKLARRAAVGHVYVPMHAGSASPPEEDIADFENHLGTKKGRDLAAQFRQETQRLELQEQKGAPVDRIGDDGPRLQQSLVPKVAANNKIERAASNALAQPRRGSTPPPHLIIANDSESTRDRAPGGKVNVQRPPDSV